MRVEETVVCRIWRPADRKRGLLVKEYSNAQGYIRGEIEDLYSATRQAMDKYVEKVKDGKEYPLFLCRDGHQFPLSNAVKLGFREGG